MREEAGKDRTKREREGGCSGPFAFWTATIQHPGAITLTAGNQELLSKTERRRQLILAEGFQMGEAAMKQQYLDAGFPSLQ